MFAFFVSIASCAYYFQHEEKSFLSWMRSTNQFYTGDEYHFRFGIFLTNSRYVKEFNAGHHNFKISLNKFSALTPAEYKARLGLRLDLSKRSTTKYTKKSNAESIDYRNKGVVNEIKDQGQCQSNYAFSLIQTIESSDAISTGKLLAFSEQNIVDCCVSTFGCNGGNPGLAFEYISEIQNGQVCLESDYPYTGSDDDCKFDDCPHYGSFNNLINVIEGDESDLASKIEYFGPTSVAIDASSATFQLYSSGIYDDPSCSAYDVNHAVGCVGFGKENDVKYWIVRNQWGTSWGEKGYIRMIWDNNQCGIATMAFIVLKGFI